MKCSSSLTDDLHNNVSIAHRTMHFIFMYKINFKALIEGDGSFDKEEMLFKLL